MGVFSDFPQTSAVPEVVNRLCGAVAVNGGVIVSAVTISAVSVLVV